MPEREEVQFRRGPSETLPETIVPGTLLIETDTGNCFVDDTPTSRVQLKDDTKLPLTGGTVTGPVSFGDFTIDENGQPSGPQEVINYWSNFIGSGDVWVDF